MLKLPGIFDLENDLYTIEFPSGMNNIFKYHESNTTIEMNPLLFRDRDLGIHKILIKLED